MSNYLRYYELIIGDPEPYTIVDSSAPKLVGVSDSFATADSFNTNSLTPSGVNLNFMTIKAEEGDGVSIGQNQMTAKIHGSVESKGSSGRSCNIKVYNLSDDTIKRITKKNLKVILKAGYKEDYDKDNLPVVFSGQIKTSTSVSKRGESFVELICIDGYTPSSAIKIHKNLKSTPVKTITANDVFNYLFSVWKDNGISTSNNSIRFDELPIHPDSVPFKGGWNGEGYLRDVMDEICNAFNYQWYIINGTLYVQSAFSSRVREALEIDMSMVKKIANGSQDGKTDSTQKEKPRFTFTTLLNGTITEEKFLSVVKTINTPASKEQYYGLYKIISVTHDLNYRGNTWDTIIECEKT